MLLDPGGTRKERINADLFGLRLAFALRQTEEPSKLGVASCFCGDVAAAGCSAPSRARGRTRRVERWPAAGTGRRLRCWWPARLRAGRGQPVRWIGWSAP